MFSNKKQQQQQYSNNMIMLYSKLNSLQHMFYAKHAHMFCLLILGIVVIIFVIIFNFFPLVWFCIGFFFISPCFGLFLVFRVIICFCHLNILFIVVGTFCTCMPGYISERSLKFMLVYRIVNWEFYLKKCYWATFWVIHEYVSMCYTALCTWYRGNR